MSKEIISPVLEFPGKVTITTEPTMPMVEAFMDAKYLHTIQELQPRPLLENGKLVYLEDGITVRMVDKWVVVDAHNITHEQIVERREKLFNAALAFVERWDIKGQPEKMSSRLDLNPLPYVAVSQLVSWFLKEIFDFCMSEREIPKALSPESTDISPTPATIEGQPS